MRFDHRVRQCTNQERPHAQVHIRTLELFRHLFMPGRPAATKAFSNDGTASLAPR